jgi:hypothetical protein
VNELKGGDLIWNEERKMKNTPMMENPILTKERVNLPTIVLFFPPL